MPTTIKGYFTCDNSYAIYKGTENGVSELLQEATNLTAGEIFSAEYIEFEAEAEDLLYLIAWSDDRTLQGLIGSFSGSETIHTGDPRWEVLATGSNKGNNVFPSLNEINGFISGADSSDWVTPFSGSENKSQEGPYFNAVNNIPEDARWVWHDSNKDSRAKYPDPMAVPFRGFNHDEFLIFRLPVVEIAPELNENDCHSEPNPCHQNVIVNCCPPQEEPNPVPPVPEKCCGTCTFEIRFQRWRYISGKPGFLDGAAELSFVCHVNGNMLNYPTANGSYVRLMKRSGGFETGWMAANIRAGILEIPCSGRRGIDLMTEMIENPKKEGGLSAVLEGGRPWGLSNVTTTFLECGKQPSAILQRVKLEHGGNASEDLEIEVEYRINEISSNSCCC